MNQSTITLKDKVIDSLINSIDNSDHNDLVIKLLDGEIHASKIILSSRSAYFETMLNKQKNFKESQSNEVNFHNCKLNVMKIVINYIYGKHLDLSTFGCCDGIEVLEMLRTLLLDEGVVEFEEKFKIQLREENYTIDQCFNALTLAETKRMDKIMDQITAHFARSLEIIVTSYQEKVSTLSETNLYKILDYIKGIEEKYVISPPPWLQLRKLKFILLWDKNDSNLTNAESKTKIQNYFQLENFTVSQLLNDVFLSKLFNQCEIFSAIEKINNNLITENKKLKDKIAVVFKI